jgi:glycosyltransferase involved in cell wall biosynthesis
MRILIVTQYYPPEGGAAQNRLSNLATYLKESGHTVTVLTALPNYPTGEIFDGYKGHLVVAEHTDGMSIIRTWLYTRPNLRFAGRLANYLSFSGLALLVSMYKVNKQDVVIAECPSLFVGIAGFIISRMKKAKFVFNVSDLWVDSAVDLGMLRSSTVIGLARSVENFLFRKADLITGQTEGIVNTIAARITNKPVELITNAVDVGRFRGATDLASHKKKGEEPNSVGRFILGYAGLHGLMQDLETVIEVASLLRSYKDIHFVFYGDGPKKDKLIRMSKEAGLQNVTFYPHQPVQRMPEIFASFDAMVIPFRQLPILKGAVPCKMIEAMAAALPILLAGEGEAKNLVEKANCGIVVEPEKAGLLAEGLLELYRSDFYRGELGQNGRQYILQHYDRRHINGKFEDLLSKVVSGEHISSVARRLLDTPPTSPTKI